jgi:hypothetical protein
MISRREALIGIGAGAVLAACGKAAAVHDRSVRSVRAVERVLAGIPAVDGAGTPLVRVIGQPRLRHLDPFILLDGLEAHARVPGFPDHPHRGFETITVMLEGQVRHRDSRGNAGIVPAGGVQWMTAGRGIVHSEFPELVDGSMLGFQLWLNLPAREKMRAQEYQDLRPSQIAEETLSSSGNVVRVIAGEVDGLRGPAAPRTTQPLLVTVRLDDDRPVEVPVPRAHVAFAYVHTGAVDVGGTRVAAPSLAVLGPGTRIRLRAPDQQSAVFLAAGAPIGEPIVQRGPFVMNSEAEIERAFDDYRRGTLAL